MDLTKHVIVVSRQWHQPDIAIDITPERATCATCGQPGAISLGMALPDFLEALTTEVAARYATGIAASLLGPLADAIVARIGNPTLLVTKEQLRTKLTAAIDEILPAIALSAATLRPALLAGSDAVVAGMKQETVRVVK